MPDRKYKQLITSQQGHNNLEYTKLGKSNLTVSKVCMGTMHFGGPTSEEEAFKIMDKALEIGLNFWDTANVYGGDGGRGKSEEIIGNYFKARPGSRDKVVLATKVYGAMTDPNIPAEDMGIGVIPYMPLAGGLLTGKKKAVEGSRTAYVEDEYGIYLGEENNQMTAFSELCQKLGEKEHVVAIAWTLNHPAVASPIVGVRTVNHLGGLERASELTFDDETLAELDKIFDANKGRPLRIGKPSPEAYAW